MVQTSCFAHDCDSLTDWDIHPLFIVSVDTAQKKQGTASLKFRKLYDGVTTERTCNLALTHCDEWLAFWYRPALVTAGSGIMIYVQKTNGAFTGFSLGCISADVAGAGGIIYDPARGYFTTGTILIANNTWHYLEMRISKTGLLIEFWVDGVNIGQVAGFNVQNYIALRVWGDGRQPEAIVNIDYIRIVTNKEYPPVYVFPNIHPFWKLVPP